MFCGPPEGRELLAGMLEAWPSAAWLESLAGSDGRLELAFVSVVALDVLCSSAALVLCSTAVLVSALVSPLVFDAAPAPQPARATTSAADTISELIYMCFICLTFSYLHAYTLLSTRKIIGNNP